MVGLSIKVRNEMARGPTLSSVAGNLLLMHTPLNGGYYSTQSLSKEISMIGMNLTLTWS